MSGGGDGVMQAFGQMGSAIIQSDAAEHAARLQSNAAQNAQNQQWSMYQQQRADQAPWRNTGAGSLAQLAWLMGVSPRGGGQGQSTQAGYVDAQGNVGFGKGLDADIQRQIQSGTYKSFGGINKPVVAWLNANGANIDEVAAQDPAKLQQAYAKAMANQGFSQVGGTTGQPGFQGNPADFGRLTRNFDASQMYQDPGYQFRLQEGQKALERSGAARGMSLSGAQLKGIGRYSQDYASNEYGNAFNRYNTENTNLYNRLANLAGMGQTSANNIGQFGQNTANQMGGYMTGAGNALGASAIAQGNAWSNAFNNGMNAWNQYNAMNNQNPNVGSYGNMGQMSTGNDMTSGWDTSMWGQMPGQVGG